VGSRDRQRPEPFTARLGRVPFLPDAAEDRARHRSEVGEAAARVCFATDESTDLKNLAAVFDVLTNRDDKLLAALSRANAIVRTKLGRA
jgi:hypothetical protein